MVKDNWQKVKLLKLAEMLRQETDEQHPLSTNELCSRLEQLGYPCERRTLSKDIAVLNDHGIEVLWSWVGKEKGYEAADYTERAIKMYGGQSESIVLEFDKTLTGAVYDRFGESISMMPVDDAKYIATVKVQLSPTFWGWLFQFVEQMKIISPETVIEEYRRRAEMLLK